jgi:GH43 family beta-xylosidase
VRQRADAQVFRHTDGWYYMTASVPEYDRLVLRRSRTLGGLGSGEEVVIWRRPASGKMAGYIWAPELHWIDGGWAFYFAAGDGDDKFHIRTYVLRGEGPILSLRNGRWRGSCRRHGIRSRWIPPALCIRGAIGWPGRRRSRGSRRTRTSISRLWRL